ncbi:hypothetical protein GCM10020001_098060 [Nonomuraea salmonea]
MGEHPPRQVAVVVVPAAQHQARGVFELPGQDLGQVALVARGRGSAERAEGLAAGDVVGQGRGVEGGEHGGEPQELAGFIAVDGLGDRARLDRVPQIDDQQGRAGRQQDELGEQVLADGAGDAAVGEAHVGRVQHADAVADGTSHAAVDDVAQIVVDGDGARMPGQQFVDGGGARRVMQAGDEDDGG